MTALPIMTLPQRTPLVSLAADIHFPETDEQLLSLLAIKITQCELVQNRGYQIPTKELPFLEPEGMTVQRFREYLTEEQRLKRERDPTAPLVLPRWLLTSYYYRIEQDATGGHRRMVLLVYYGNVKETSKSGQVDKKTVQEFIGLARDQAMMFRTANQPATLERTLLIIPSTLNSDARMELSKFTTIPVDVYLDENLTYNPDTHVDTAKHELLSAAEAKTVKERLHVTNKDFMIIDHDDPIVKHYGWPREGLVRINRNDDEVNVIVDTSTNYRIIV